MDYDTPPIYLTTAQQEKGSKLLWEMVGALIGIFAVYFFVELIFPRFFSRNEEMKKKKLLKDIEASDRFVLNFHDLIKTIFNPAIVPKALMDKPTKFIPWVFLALWVVAIIVIQVGLTSISASNPTTRNDTAIQVGLVMYFASLIGYYLSRTFSYYKMKIDMRKKAQAHQKRDVRQSTADMVISMDRQASTESGPLTLSHHSDESEDFDREFSYKRRVKHITPIIEKIDLIPFNAIQLFVIVTEFIQLGSFPIRDLFRSIVFLQSIQLPQGQSSKNFIDNIRSFFAIFATGTSTEDLNYIKFLLCWWLTLMGVCIAILFTIVQFLLNWEKTADLIPISYQKEIKKFITGPWIILFLPLINLCYLIILNSFLEPLSCLSRPLTIKSDSSSELGMKRLHGPRPMNPDMINYRKDTVNFNMAEKKAISLHSNHSNSSIAKVSNVNGEDIISIEPSTANTVILEKVPLPPSDTDSAPLPTLNSNSNVVDLTSDISRESKPPISFASTTPITSPITERPTRKLMGPRAMNMGNPAAPNFSSPSQPAKENADVQENPVPPNSDTNV
ncbi:hypothetical protein HDV01_001212 [Terramyces sp. JEL0728]|nr:hypothetical protein HDV01_001212 [Terramyces sp. JEL0728]